MYFIVLAAGQGTRLRPLTNTRPKCLVNINGKSLLDWHMLVARRGGIKNIAIVRGYKREMIDEPHVTYFENMEYKTTNMVETLWCAESVFGDEFIVSYGDILYETRVLENLLSTNYAVGVVVDRGW